MPAHAAPETSFSSSAISTFRARSSRSENDALRSKSATVRAASGFFRAKPRMAPPSTIFRWASSLRELADVPTRAFSLARSASSRAMRVANSRSAIGRSACFRALPPESRALGGRHRPNTKRGPTALSFTDGEAPVRLGALEQSNRELHIATLAQGPVIMRKKLVQELNFGVMTSLEKRVELVLSKVIDEERR